MARLRRPPEWGVEPVPDSLRLLRTFDLFVLWSSLGVGLLVLAAGTLLVTALGLTLWETFLVALAGSVVGGLFLAGAAHHGSRAGVPTMVSLRPILGRTGSYVPTSLNLLQLLGWTAFELWIMAEAAAILTGNALGPWTAAVFVPLWGAIAMALALGGPLAVVRNWLERFAIWLVYGSTIAVGVAILLRGVDPNLRAVPAAPALAGIGPLLLGLDLVVAMPISWWPLVADYNRFARSPRASATGTSLGYIAANTTFYLLGAALVLVGITAFGLDPANPKAFLVTLGLLGLGVLPLIAILVDETDNAFADVYSSAVSVQNLAPKIRQATIIGAATLIGVFAAWLMIGSGQGIGGTYESFLLLIGGLFVPLLGVVIADSFVIRRGHYSRTEFLAVGRRWRWPAFASWLSGIAVYFAIVVLTFPTGATLPSFAVAAGLHIGLAKVEQRITRSSTATSNEGT